MGCEIRDAGRSTHPGRAATAVVPKPLTLRLLMQVWGSASPMLKRVWSSSREHEVMEEWLDEVALQNHAKMVLKGASAWPEKDREHKTKHAREPQHCPPKPAHAQCDRHRSPATSHPPR